MSNRCPWIIIASAAALLSFMSGYACFLAPIAGIMASGESFQWQSPRTILTVFLRLLDRKTSSC